MASESTPAKRTQHEPTLGRPWMIRDPKPESRSELPPEDPERLMAERVARRGLNPPPVTIRRVG